MSDPAEEARREKLKELEARIDAAKRAGEPGKAHQDEHYSQAHLAWRMVIELVAGIAIGLGIGLGLDAVFGTRPIFLVLFILLGFAAGVRTMLRSAEEIQRERQVDTGRDQKNEAPPGRGERD